MKKFVIIVLLLSIIIVQSNSFQVIGANSFEGDQVELNAFESGFFNKMSSKSKEERNGSISVDTINSTTDIVEIGDIKYEKRPLFISYCLMMAISLRRRLMNRRKTESIRTNLLT
ncbi:MAG: hypothetical protein K9L02_04195 [Acholeplasmataceae bacterium]|nr:hypothetical protein [Acholeplasmataceae bacterium]